MSSFAANYLARLNAALKSVSAERVDQAVDVLRVARDTGQTIYSCGNGGSASIASQMVVDIVKGASYGKSRRVKMMSLCDSVSTITAYSNDVDYDCVFEEQLKNWLEPNDVVIAISGSGNSENVIRAVRYANSKGAVTIGCTTGTGGKLKELSAIPLLVDTDHMGHLEDCFFVMTHVMCYALMGDQ